jgi:hypothetical protein
VPFRCTGYTGETTVEPIAYVYFDDGAERLVFEDERGQFVFDDDGNGVDGIWYIPEKCGRLVQSNGVEYPTPLRCWAASSALTAVRNL